jgi:hypothetical protein
MGEVISGTADVNRIRDDVRTSLRNAASRGGEIVTAAQSRLGPSVDAMETAAKILETATAAEAAAWSPVLAADDVADTTIGATRDEMYNALGRPKHSPHMDHVYPGGIGTYTAGDPRGQPVLMQVLETRIRSATAPQWPESLRDKWATAVDAARIPLAAAVEAHRPAEAALTVAEAGFRAAVRAAHAKLVAFKRDLKNLGLTETQIHEIIPDRPSSSGKAKGGGGNDNG